jgi:hypothetical protein
MPSNKKMPRRRAKNGGMQRGIPRFPPSIVVRPVQSMCIRYRNSAEIVETSPALLSTDRLSRMLCAVATETTSAQATPVFNAVRIKHIDFWASNTQTTGTFPSALESIRVVWDSTAISNRYGNEPREVISAYGNVNMPAKLRVYPPKNTLQPMWFTVGNITGVAQLWVEVLPINSVMDIHFDYILADFTEIGGATENFGEFTLTASEVSGIYAVFPSTAGGFTPQGWEVVDVASIPLLKSVPDAPCGTVTSGQQQPVVPTTQPALVQQAAPARRRLALR